MKLFENETILLRALEPEDLDVLYKWENDSRMWRYGDTLAPYSRYALKEYLQESRMGFFHSRQLRLMIVLKEGNRIAGSIDLYDFEPTHLRASIGILIDEDYRRQGIGKQAMDLIAEYAFRFLMLKQIYAYVPEQNEPSVQLLIRCGYRIAGTLKDWIRYDGMYEDVYLMQLIAP
jgi:diamine N-acetyltransferase